MSNNHFTIYSTNTNVPPPPLPASSSSTTTTTTTTATTLPQPPPPPPQGYQHPPTQFNQSSQPPFYRAAVNSPAVLDSVAIFSLGHRHYANEAPPGPEPPYRANCAHIYTTGKETKYMGADGKALQGQMTSCSRCGHVRNFEVMDWARAREEDNYYRGY